MGLTKHYTWHVQIQSTYPGSVMRVVHEFRDSGFIVTELPGRIDWKYSLTHSNPAAMTLHLLTVDSVNFTVLHEFANV